MTILTNTTPFKLNYKDISIIRLWTHDDDLSNKIGENGIIKIKRRKRKFRFGFSVGFDFVFLGKDMILSVECFITCEKKAKKNKKKIVGWMNEME